MEKEEKKKHVSLSKLKKTFIAGIVVGLFISFACVFTFREKVTKPIHTLRDNFDNFIDNTFFGYTSLDFKEAIESASTQESKLQVFEQNIIIPMEIKKSGLFDWNVFAKVKEVDFAAVGEYVVDLAKLETDDITVDFSNRIVTITAPRPQLDSAYLDIDSTTYQDTEKGMLAFGELELTIEKYNQIEKEVIIQAKKILTSDDLMAKTYDSANVALQKLFAAAVKSISNDFSVQVVFR